MAGRTKQVALATAPGGTWVQTERRAHEQWAKLSVSNPRAAAVLHVMISQMGRHNAIVASHAVLAKAADCSVATLKRSLAVLREQNWIEVRQIGPTGTACAYIVNDRVAWLGKRDSLRYSMFSATVIVSEDEQPDRKELDSQTPLVKIPDLYPGERQLPHGPGLDPPSEPALPGFEMDLPTRKARH